MLCLSERGEFSEGIALVEEAVQIAEALPLLQQAVEQATVRKFMGLQARRVAWLSEVHLLADHRDEAPP